VAAAASKALCENHQERSKCKECGGSSICEHLRQRSQCKDSASAASASTSRKGASAKIVKWSKARLQERKRERKG